MRKKSAGKKQQTMVRPAMDMTVHPTGPPSISVGAIVGIIAMHRSWTKPLGLLQLFFSGLV